MDAALKPRDAHRTPGPGDWDARRSPRQSLRPDTLAVRGGLVRSEFNEMSEALLLTQGYVYATAAEAEAAFAGEVDRFVYSRYGNPTGSRIVATRALFGSTVVIFDEILAKWGVRTDYVDGHLPAQWEGRSTTGSCWGRIRWGASP